MDKLKELYNEYVNDSTIPPIKILHKIFEIYLPDVEKLNELGLEIRHHDYGIYQVRQKGEVIKEGELTACLERCNEIINKLI